MIYDGRKGAVMYVLINAGYADLGHYQKERAIMPAVNELTHAIIPLQCHSCHTCVTPETGQV